MDCATSKDGPVEVGPAEDGPVVRLVKVDDLLTNANRLTTVDAVGNHFRCDGDTGTWPDWAMRLGGVNAFGMCTKVPVPSAVGPAESITGGGLVYIDGVDFLASDELRCRVGACSLSSIAAPTPPV